MSISVESFGSVGVFATFDPHALRPAPLQMFSFQCRSCGGDGAENMMASDAPCPKCGGRIERVPLPRSLLAAATPLRRRSGGGA